MNLMAGKAPLPCQKLVSSSVSILEGCCIKIVGRGLGVDRFSGKGLFVFDDVPPGYSAVAPEKTRSFKDGGESSAPHHLSPPVSHPDGPRGRKSAGRDLEVLFGRAEKSGAEGLASSPKDGRVSLSLFLPLPQGKRESSTNNDSPV